MTGDAFIKIMLMSMFILTGISSLDAFEPPLPERSFPDVQGAVQQSPAEARGARLRNKVREDYFEITGRILDKKNSPKENVYAFAVRGMQVLEIPDFISAWTDSSGSYRLYLPAGRYFLGYSSEFPLKVHNNVLIELNVRSSLERVDITAVAH